MSAHDSAAWCVCGHHASLHRFVVGKGLHPPCEQCDCRAFDSKGSKP